MLAPNHLPVDEDMDDAGYVEGDGYDDEGEAIDGLPADLAVAWA